LVKHLPQYIHLLVLLLCTIFSSYASSTPLNQKVIPVKSYKKETGLLSDTVKDVIQDEKGFLWIATDKGLSRFDSKNFKHFVPDKSNNNSIPSNDIDFMMNIPKNKLWLSVFDVGISSINKTTFTFNSIKNKISPLFDLQNKNLYGMAHDQNYNLWISLFGAGIYQWKTSQQILIKHTPENKDPWLKSKKTFEIFIDSKNILWVCTIDSKIYRYNINTGESKEFLFTKKNEDPMSNPLYGFTESQGGEIYAGGYSGVYKFNAAKQSFEPFISKDQIANFYKGNRVSVRRLTIDSKENIWIGTTKSLLLFSNNSLSKVSFFENGEFIKGDWTISSIIEDLDGNIWIATDGVGLIKIPYDWERFIVSSDQDAKSDPVTNATLFQNNLWISHSSSKLDLFTIENENLHFKKELHLDLGNKDVNIDKTLQYNNDYLWVTSLKGIHRVNLTTGETSKIKTNKTQELNSVTQLIHSENKFLYFSTFDGEIGYINDTDLNAHIISQDLLTDNKLAKIINGFDQSVWFLASNKIVSLNTKHKTLKTIYRIPKEQNISEIFIEQEKDKVWIIKNGGLFLLKWDSDTLTLIEQDNYFANILPTVVFTQIVKIQGDTFLMNTVDSGFVELNIHTLEYKVFTTENGLPSNSIKKIIKHKQSLIIVTEAGIAIQNPNFNGQHTLIPQIIIDEISLGDNPFSEKEKTNLTIDYNYGSINFDVALLSYTDSSTFEYQYRLKGATNKWIDAGNDNKFAFLNLKGGHYNFQIKGRSNYGKWSEIAEFPFTVKAAPWKTLWAYILYAISAVLILSWLLYLYKRKILYEHEISKKQAQKDLADAASKAKSDFLARVSHEVRTPLNGVLGMSELLLDTQVDEEQKIYADTIHTSGKHLLDIINDILDLSKIEAGKLELEELPFDLLLLVDEVCSSFISQCRQKQLMFSCVFDHKTPRNRIGDVIRLKQILFNLLSNAFKFTKEGEVFIKISGEEETDNVVISVQDTGIGIDEKLVQSLFEPFVQADSAITRKFGGTGLGLAICKQLTEKMNGTIDVVSKINTGTTFTISIPLKFDKKTALLKDKQASQSNICLLLEESHIKQSIVEYCYLLSISYSNQINNKTKCVFVDQKFIAGGQFNQVLVLAKNQNTKIIAISFDEHAYPEHLKALNIPLITSPPPLTFKKMQELCLDEFSVDQSNLNPMKIIKHQRVLKLLVIEDSAINQQVSIEMLEKMGHMVDVVDNAEEGLTMLQRNNYDMLFLDYHLPGMDGFQLVQQWKNTQNIPVVMVTADLTDDVLIKAQKYHMTDVVAKPFSQQTLSNIIHKTMGFEQSNN